MAKATRKKTHQRKSTPKKSTSKTTNSRKAAHKTSTKKAPHKWSKKVNETSDAMDLKTGIFKEDDPKKIARSIKASATKSRRRKASPYQSAMSMLNFYINRGGKNLPVSKKETLEKAKDELRNLFGKEG